MVGLGFGGLVVCVLDKKPGKMRSNLMDHGGQPPATKHTTIN